MSRERFEAQHGEEWKELEGLLHALDRRKRPESAERFVALYRSVCQHLALARHRHYGADLVTRLNRLALRGHQHLYTRRAGLSRAAVDYIARGFPRDVRANQRYVWASALLFFGPFLLLVGLIQAQPDLVHSVLPRRMVEGLEAMYDPEGRGDLGERSPADNVVMFGHYVQNNVSIAFRTFAGGILVGLGSIFFLLYNGIVIGAAAGHLTRIGFGVTFWPFVVGHGALELTAIVLAGASGLKLGHAVVAPGRRSRQRALVEEARASMGLVYGFAVMLVAAACVEAFWSPLRFVPPPVKYTVGGALWVVVLGYFAFVGRDRGP